jgi:nucleotide-binding universal stress UspA family protein
MGPGVGAPLKILLALDNSPYSAAAVSLLNCITWPAGTVIDLLAVVPERLPVMETRPEVRRQVDEGAEITRWRDWAATKVLATQTAARIRSERLTVKTDIGEGELAGLILDRSEVSAADLVVVGAAPPNVSNTGERNMMIDRLVREVRAAVLLVRPAKPVRPLSTILAIDSSAAAWRAVQFVSILSLANWARLTVISLAEDGDRLPAGPGDLDPGRPTAVRQVGRASPDPAEGRAREVVGYLRSRGVQVRWACRSGSAADQVLSAAAEQGAVLIVTSMGSQDSNRLSASPNPAWEIAASAPCSVLLVR